MDSYTTVFIPLLNPNEPEALLVTLQIREGQQVAKGDPLCTLETTKSTAELQAELDGYVIGLRYDAGQTVRAGDILCYLAEDPAWRPPQTAHTTMPANAVSAQVPDGLRITQPAMALARQENLDLTRLPQDQLVTESTVRALLNKKPEEEGFTIPASAFDPSAIIVYGGGGHGKSLIDLLRLLGTYHILGVVDDGIPKDTLIMGLPVLGGAEALPGLHALGVRLAVNAVGGIGNLAPRITVFQKLAEAGFACPAVIHPTAFVEPSATLSPAVQIFPHAYVGSETRLGFGCIVNTGAIVSHDCVLGDLANISPGAMLAGEVQVGQGALVGMGATVNLQVKIGARARIGNGATVKLDVPENAVVRAGSTWPA
jgi:sugar O-acyltransferase (sialic acid O-acetyltransferase NeuD family)